ncbi:MAG: aminoacyl-tRNA hydrolase [Fibrobacterota bacterium]
MSEYTAVIIGIGNPGTEYEGTRHNVGVEILDSLLDSSFFPSFQEYENGFSTSYTTMNHSLMLVRPHTYVNASGAAVAELCSHYHITANELLIIVDDFHLPLGKIRYRSGGSDGGHKGIRSIIEEIGQDFDRLKFGIGAVPGNETVTEFVLGGFSADEQRVLEPAVSNAVESVCAYVQDGIEATMNRFNG